MKLYFRHIIFDEGNEFDSTDYTDCTFCGRVFHIREHMALIESDDGTERDRRMSWGVACSACRVSPIEELALIIKNRQRIISQRIDEFEPEWVMGYLEAMLEYDSIEHTGLRMNRPSAIRGYVYLLGSPDGYCKIGRAKRVTERILQIGLQLPYRVELLHHLESSDCVWAEKHLHRKFANERMNGEWFQLTSDQIQWVRSLSKLEPEGIPCNGE